MKVLGAILFFAMVTASCDGDDGGKRPPALTGGPPFGPQWEAGPLGDGSPDGAPGDGGDASLGDGGGADGFVPTYEGCTDPRRPVVALTAPSPSEDPTTDDVVTANQLELSCRVTPSIHEEASLVEPSSVVLTVMDGNRSELGRPAVRVGDDGEYVATMELTEVTSGPVVVQCYATDDSDPPRCSLAEVSTLVDRGPVVTIEDPEPDSIHSFSMSLRLSILPAPLSDADPGAEVAEYSVVVAGRRIEVEEDQPGQFAVNLDFGDRTIFTEPLRGQYQLIVRAVNARGVARTVTQDFTVDGDGPTVQITDPPEGRLVGGLFAVRAEIADDSGVDESRVFLRVGTEQFPMPRTHGTNTFSRTFDASGFANTVTEITLNVVASDTVGNGTTAYRTVKLDSVPPVASLDPPYVREAREVRGELECSESFDPLGEDSAHDGQAVGTAAEFRARVQDLSNSTLSHSGTVVFLSEVDPSAVDLYILDNTDVPLLVDTTGDGMCDEINEDVDPARGGLDTAIIIEMEAIAPAGSAYWPPIPEESKPTEFPFSWCDRGGTATKAPDPICEESSPLNRVIPSSYSQMTRTIFGKPPIHAGETCIGDAWDFQSSISEGWACVALRAEDKLGNVGLAPPLRVCFMDRFGPNPCPVPLGQIAPEGVRPRCTDGCTIPPSFADFPILNLIYPD